MRLKEDTSSWHSSSIIKRDFKHGNVPVPDVNKMKKHKDTRKWCRGKVGVEHQWLRYQRYHFGWYDDYIDPYVYVKCTVCGKDGYKRRTKYSYLPFQIEVKHWCEHTPIQVRLGDGSYSDVNEYHPAHWE